MISDRELGELVEAGIVDEETAVAIRAYLDDKYGDRPRFDITSVGYYFGALIVMLAFAWFLFEGYDRYAGGALMAIAPSYALLFVLGGNWLWKQPRLKDAGGLLFTLAICMVPIFVYGFEEYMGWYPILAGAIDDRPDAAAIEYGRQVNFAGIWIALAAVVVGIAVLPLRRFAFMAVVPIVAFHQLWLAIMSVMVGGRPDDLQLGTHLMLSGLVVMAVGFVVDRRTEEDFAFWLYGLGVAHFWVGLVNLPFDSEIAWIGFVLVNLLLMIVSILLQRRVFMVAGALGVFIYLGHLGFETFEDSLLFPFVLIFVGLAIIGAAVWYQKHKREIEGAMLGILPAAVRKRLPSVRRRAEESSDSA